MKRIKKLFINFIAALMLCTACFGLTACEDIKELELNVKVYDFTNSKFVEQTISVELYRHLAPTTVDSIVSCVENGYYNGALIYKHTGYSSQVMLGDLKFASDAVVLNDKAAPTVSKAEFKNGGTQGSNLINAKGSVGLWRSWYAADGSYNVSSEARLSGKATWYMPTADITSYNDWFCVFAQIDLENEDNAKAFSLIEAAYGDSAAYDEYVVYYTGTYDQTKENCGLTFNAVEKADFVESEIEDLFKAEGEQLVCYNHYTVKVAKKEKGGEIAVQVVSATVR